MSKNNNNSAVVSAAELLTAYNDAVTARAVLNEESSKEEIAAADALIKSQKENYDKALAKEEKTKEPKEKKVKVRALLSLAGKFLLPYDPGHVFSIAENQANEIVEAKYGEFVK
jgi:hypothetical protein